MACGLDETRGPEQGGTGTSVRATAAAAKASAQAAFATMDARWAQTRARARRDLARLADPQCPEGCREVDRDRGIDVVRGVGVPRRRRGRRGFECDWWSTAQAYSWVDCVEEEKREPPPKRPPTKREG